MGQQAGRDAVSQGKRISIQMLGQPTLEWNGEQVVIAARKSLALVCLLALRQEPLSRDEVARLLWNSRLSNVRQALYQLRQLPGAENWIDAGEQLGLHASTDVHEFERLLNAGEYEAALQLWRGPFLSGLNLDDDAAELQRMFDDEAARLDELFRRALTARTAELEEDGELQPALDLVTQLLRLDPLDEVALRHALRLEFLLERPEAALSRYRSWVEHLAEELDAQPDPETRQLAQAIERGQLPSGTSMDALPGSLRQLLAAIHVGGGRLGIDELAQVLRRGAFEVAESLEALQRTGLLDEHGQVRGIVDVRLPPAKAQLLAGRVAEVLEQGPVRGYEDKLSLARHWTRAQKPERAARWFLEGAKAALQASALDDAKAACFRASWAGSTRERFEAMLLLESICSRRGDDSLQSVALDEATDLAWELQDDHALCKVHIGRARSFLRRKQNALALQFAVEALGIAERTGVPELLAIAHNAIGVVHFSTGDLDAAITAFHNCAAQDIPGESTRALSNLGSIHGMRDEHEEAYRLFEQALTRARATRDLVTVSACLNNLSASAERLGAYDRALKHLHEGRQLARRLNDRPMEAQLIHNLSIIYMRQGAFGPAWNTSWEVVEEGERTADIALQAQGLSQAADVARHCAAHERQRELLERAGELLRELGDSRRLLTHDAAVALSDAGPHREVPEPVRAVGRFGLRAVFNWLLLELALASNDPEAGLAFLAETELQGPHQLFVADLARARLLLSQDPVAHGWELAELRERIEQAVETSEFAEAPLACHLLAQLHDGPEATNIWPAHRDELLAEQVRGLPRDLAQSLLEQPVRWLSSVSHR